jgi:DNA-binding Lrp family transcriptional regulator
MRAGGSVDRIDLQILSHLQRAGRCSNVDLADSVGLTPSPCLARVKRLQDNGYISSYGAHLELAKLGDVLVVFTEVTLSEHRRRDLRRFEEVARECPEIMECYNLSGGYDYLLKIVARSVLHYQNRMDALLAADVGITRFSSYIVLRMPFIKREYPLETLFRT